MADNAKHYPPGQEKAIIGTGGTPKPAGQELATVKNGNLANAGNANKAV